MENVYQYLEMRNKKRASFNGLYRIDTLDYPLDALREALLNCLVHRDYSFSASTLISVYDDRIEFVSVGGLPDGINLDDILLGISACRNPKLAAIFYRLELIEAYGTGIPKIMSSYKDTGFEPKIEVTNNAFKITLPNLNYSIDEQTETEDNRIVAFIDKNGFITRKDVEELLGISQTSANRILKDMVDKSVLYRIGNGKSIKYKKK